MRWIVYGAGAVGGVIGARLFQAGADVVLIARGAHLDAIRRKGLLFQSPLEETTLAVPAVGHPSEIRFGTDDVVLLAVKSQQTPVALADLDAAAGESVPLFCCQNGVANERMAARRFDRVYAVGVMLPASHLEPGRVQAHSRATPGILDLGRYPAGGDALAAEVAAGLERAGFSSRPDPAVMRQKYAKLLLNLGNALVAALDAPREAGDLLGAARAEAECCYRAAGIDWTSDEEFRARRGDLIDPAPVAGERRGGGSTWQSLTRARGDVEVDFLNGEIVLLGRLHGVPTPVNRALQLTTNRLAREGRPPRSVPVAELRVLVARLSES
jgi:2-dehydropantoate 2-reductase